jgi:hypothetical protein
MRLRYTILALALTLCAAAVMPPIASADDDIPHFRRISEIVARGGTPTEKGIRKLYNDHVLTVVDLRQPGPETVAESAQVERQQEDYINSSKMEYINLPIDEKGPTPEQIAHFLAIIDCVTSNPHMDWTPGVYVHGSDPSITSCLLGICRIKLQGWSFKKTYEEMRTNGFDAKLSHLYDLVKNFSKETPVPTRPCP